MRIRIPFPARVAALLLTALSLAGAEGDLLVVHRTDAGGWVLAWRGKEYRCAVGAKGVAPEGEKREGDGRTPGGTFPLRSPRFRPDRVDRRSIPDRLAPVAITPEDGWCDDPADPRYNRPVRLPYPASHEDLWREDHLYDLVIPIGCNDDPAVPGLGSAIFLHVARPAYGPTAGCVALSLPDLLEILRTLPEGARIHIQPD